jgi:hypothetical protein
MLAFAKTLFERTNNLEEANGDGRISQLSPAPVLDSNWFY